MKRTLLFFLFAFALLTINAEENYNDLFKDISSDTKKVESSDVNKTNTDIGFELGLSGTHEFDFRMPVDGDNFNFNGYVKSPKFINDLGIDIIYKKLKVISYWNLSIILNEVYGQDNINNIDIAKLLRALPEENKIEWSPWKFKIAAGYQYFTWGVADKINPTDNINPLDYTDFTLSNFVKKLPTLSAYVGFYPFKFMSIDLVYVPFGEKSIFTTDVVQELENQLGAVSVNIISKDFDPTKFKLGGKLNFYFPSVDFSFSYLYDIDTFYTPEIELKKVDLSASYGTDAYNFYQISSIDLVQKRLHRFGFDIKTIVKQFGLWAEVCYTMTENYLMDSYEIRNHQLEWVLGMDFNYGPGSNFYINFQYIGIFIPNFDRRFYKDYGTDPQNPFSTGQSEDYYEKYYYRAFTNKIGGYTEGMNQAVSCGMEWPVMDSLLKPALSLAYFIPLLYDYDYDFKYGTLILGPNIDIMPFDSFHIIIGSDLIFSWHKPKDKGVELDRNYSYGTYIQNNNAYIEIKYSWNYLLKK